MNNGTTPQKIRHGTTINIPDILHIRDKLYQYTNKTGQTTYTKRYYYYMRNGDTLLIPWSVHQQLTHKHQTTRKEHYLVTVEGTGTNTTYKVHET